MARGVQRDDAVGGRVGGHREIGVEVAGRGAQVAGDDHPGQRLEGRVGKARDAGVVHAAHAHLTPLGQRPVHEGQRPLDAAELPDLHHGAAQFRMIEQTGGLFGIHEGLVHADGHGQRMLKRRESHERIAQCPLAPGGGQVQRLFDPADVQLVVGAQLGQVVQPEALVRVQGNKQMRERPTHRAHRRKPSAGSHFQLDTLVARVHALAHLGHGLGGSPQAHHRAAVHLARRPAPVAGTR